jgi:hypothetical protein
VQVIKIKKSRKKVAKNRVFTKGTNLKIGDKIFKVNHKAL